MEFFVCWWFCCLLIPLVLAGQRRRRERQMGPRILVEPDAFVRMVNQHQSEVICRPGRVWGKSQYLARIGDYFYFCFSHQDLAGFFSDKVSVSPCQGIWL
jgi:hypothetical protein